MNKELIETARMKANNTFVSRSPNEIICKIKETQKKIREYSKNCASKREAFMDKLLTEAQKADETKRAKAIKEIKNRKDSSIRSHRIKTALGRQKNNRITKIEVPDEDDEVNQIGWKVICTEAEVHERILKRNKEHMDQARGKPF